MAKNWIKKAVKHKGALTRKAKAAGKTVAQFSSGYKGTDTTTKRQIALAKTLKSLNKGYG